MSASTLRRLGILLLAGLLLSGTAARGEEPDPCLRRTVLASVLTEAGQSVAGLTANSFRGTFRGKPVRVLSATREMQPLRVVVMLDASGSMLEINEWQIARQAVGDIVNSLPPQGEIAMVMFASKVDLVVSFAEGRQAILDKAAALAVGKKALPKGPRTTALLDAILEGLKLVQPPHEGDVIYLITDGGENASSAYSGKVEQALLTAGVRVFTTGFVVHVNRLTSDEAIGQSLLQKLSEDTGGDFFLIEGYFRRPQQDEVYSLTEQQAEALGLRMKAFYSQMTQPYRLEIELTEPVDKQRKWKLELVDDNGKESKVWHAIYQSTLLPCKRVTAK